MAARFRLRAWTGPSFVGQITEACRAAGLYAHAGTEHVYVDSDDGREPRAAAHNALVDLLRKHGTDFGLRFALHGDWPDDYQAPNQHLRAHP